MAVGKTGRRGPRAIALDLPKGGPITVYANARVADALQDLTEDMSLYAGVRFSQVVEAVYEQGRRDGRREVFDELEKMKQLPALKHRNPGRPAKRAAKKAAPSTKRP